MFTIQSPVLTVALDPAVDVVTQPRSSPIPTEIFSKDQVAEIASNAVAVTQTIQVEN